ncbi:translesion error-prone DNA polymerase V autoproteolytic subunit [Sediminibacterium roseum]|uniref:Translesion error-prone DNA polymerase V autoproteolytic subunit n=1 Tax=Sediminibacterium roseum TaxID=1978412 RepID=A0ABW9ZNV6_9BACT|nr:translesion error-prone DNA polymerase V autoproteolytic subunit [Sediminibacterium roseum]NCI48766.1 translesion error-prone DNA polymerase V autoproteolytic subunit [Sediminibacterium roseum]
MDGQQWYGAYSGSDDYMERSIDLNEQLIRNRPATFFFRMNSDAMIDAGIHSGDILIVDRSIKAVSGKIIVAVINGELLVRKLQTHIRGVTLIAENKRYGNIQVDEFSSYVAWGVVVYAIHGF